MDFNGRPLAMCLEKIAEQKQILRGVQNSLPENIAQHAMHCVLSNTRLIVYTDSAVWASQIRFFSPIILDNLQASGRRTIDKVQVKLLLLPKPIPHNRMARLPAAATIDGVFGRLDDKSADALDVALAKLARTLKKRLALKADS